MRLFNKDHLGKLVLDLTLLCLPCGAENMVMGDVSDEPALYEDYIYCVEVLREGIEGADEYYGPNTKLSCRDIIEMYSP